MAMGAGRDASRVGLPAKEDFEGSDPAPAGVTEEHLQGPKNAGFGRVAPRLSLDPFPDPNSGSRVCV